jgi:hypothetical protein
MQPSRAPSSEDFYGRHVRCRLSAIEAPLLTVFRDPYGGPFVVISACQRKKATLAMSRPDCGTNRKWGWAVRTGHGGGTTMVSAS